MDTPPSSSMTPNSDPSPASQQRQPKKRPLPRAWIQTSTDKHQTFSAKISPEFVKGTFSTTPSENTDAKLKDLIIENVEDEYINDLKKKYIGYKIKTTKTFLAHIKQEWVKSTTH